MDIQSSGSNRPVTGPLPATGPAASPSALPSAEALQAVMAADRGGATSELYQAYQPPAPAAPPKKKKKKGLFGKVFGGIGKALKKAAKALPIASTVMSFIPGLNVAGWAMKAVTWASRGIQAVNAIRNKDFLGGALAAAGGIGGKIGEAVGKFQQSGLGQAVTKANDVAQGYRHGGVLGALGAGGGALGGEAGKYVAGAASGARAVQNRDWSGAFDAAASTGVLGDSSAVRRAGDAVRIEEAARRKDVAGALQAFAQSDMAPTDERFHQANAAIQATDAARRGDYSGAIRHAQETGIVQPSEHLNKLAGGIDAVQAGRYGNYAGAFEAARQSGLVGDFQGAGQVDDALKSFQAIRHDDPETALRLAEERMRREQGGP